MSIPATSLEAYRDASSSGERWRHLDAVSIYVRRHPGRTASEIAAAVGLDPVETRRRLTDLKTRKDPELAPVRQGAARVAAGQTRRELTWWPAWGDGGQIGLF